MSDQDISEIELGPELELVALHLAAGDSHAQAGMVVGKSAKFVQRSLRNVAGFRERVEALKAERVQQASAALGALLERAIATVARNLDAERPADQLAAARLVLDRSRLFRDDAEMAVEVRELKANVDLLAQVAGLSGEGRS